MISGARKKKVAEKRGYEREKSGRGLALRELLPIALEFGIPSPRFWGILPSEVIRENKKIGRESEMQAAGALSNPSEPERLPLCFCYESETSRLPQDGVVAILSFIANKRGE